MNILSKVTWKGMWKNRTRTIVTIFGIILSAAMFMAVTTLGYSLWDYLIRTEIHNSGDYFLRFDYTTSEHLDSLSADDRTSRLGTLGILGYTTFELQQREDYVSRETCAVAAGDQAFYDMVSIRMEKGRLPQSSNEIVITENIYHYLKDAGQPCEIGETVTLNIIPEYAEYEGEIPLPADGEAFTKSYTIVGISATFVRLNDLDLYLSHLFTFADAGDSPLWYRLYLKTHNPRDAYPVMREMPEGIAGSTNDSLLEYYGVTQYANYNAMITLICGVLAAIIMVGSVSLIYNAFSISVSERTKQFGLLSSVGATRKQIRGAVFTEAVLLSGIGIPLGILSGYVGIAITLNILSGRINTLLSTSGGTIFLEPKLSWLAAVIAAAIALFTVLISAAIPAGRATKISPIDAIRQKNDYSVPKKTIRVSKAAYKLFGLPGVLSRKYYKVSKKKYRATVISLVISIILFICASSVSMMINETVDRTIDTGNFDMLCMGDKETLKEIRNQDFVDKSAYYADGYYQVYVPDSQLSDSYLDCWEAIHDAYDMLDKNMHDIRLLYLEDSVFKQYLREHNLPESEYFDSDIPTALVIGKEVTVYNFHAAVGEADRFTYSYAPYDAEGEILQMLEGTVPAGINPFESEGPGTSGYNYLSTEAGEPILEIVPYVDLGDGRIGEDRDNRVEYLIRMETNQEGKTIASYFQRDITTGAVAETPVTSEEVTAPCVRIGATIRDLPFGVSFDAIEAYYYNYLVLPLSAAPSDTSVDLCITVSNYTAAKTYLDSALGEYDYRDYKENEENNRTLILLINVFSYGFIILISLISVANVFNTISTNVGLRRRDFGMLRSAGFREKDLLRMMNYECLTYGCKALVWGVPISLVLSYLIQAIDRGITNTEFVPPWNALLIAALCVFIVVFTTMFYAVSRLRKDNPIDAIRMENT